MEVRCWVIAFNLEFLKIFWKPQVLTANCSFWPPRHLERQLPTDEETVILCAACFRGGAFWESWVHLSFFSRLVFSCKKTPQRHFLVSDASKSAEL